MFSSWKPEYTLEKILIGLKNEMVINKKAPQPADGDMFWAAWSILEYAWFSFWKLNWISNIFAQISFA